MRVDFEYLGDTTKITFKVDSNSAVSAAFDLLVSEYNKQISENLDTAVYSNNMFEFLVDIPLEKRLEIIGGILNYVSDGIKYPKEENDYTKAIDGFIEALSNDMRDFNVIREI